MPALAFVGLVGIETDWGLQLRRLPAAPQAIEPKPVVPALLPEYQVEGGVASLNETVDRTLFNPTRRPAPPATASAEGEKKVQSGQFVLTGTTLAGDRSIAFLKEVAGGKARTVRKGDKINGMLVADVLPDRVRFTRGDESEELDAQSLGRPEDHGRSRAGSAGCSRAGTLGCRRPAFGGSGRAPAAPPPAKVSQPAAAPQTGRGARAAARAAAESTEEPRQPAAAASMRRRPGATPTDAWGQVYQRMQRGNARNANDVSTAPGATRKAGRRPRRGPFIGNEQPDRARQGCLGQTTMTNRISASGTILAAIVLLAGCAATYRPDRGTDIATLPSAPLKSAATARRHDDSAGGPLPEGTETTKVYKGTGILVKGQQPGGALPAASPGAVASGPSVTLNFEGAELREVIRNILTDILGESYTIDPAVGGTVTIRTTSGIPREALPATLEMILRSNGATMIKEGTIWKVVPAATAVRGNITPQLGNSSRAIPPATASRSCRSSTSACGR